MDLDAAWNAAQERLPGLRAALSALPHPTAATVQRIGQLDAEQLDQDLVQLLKEPITKALGLFHVLQLSPLLRRHAFLRCMQSSLGFKFEPELVALTSAILYKFSVWDSGATYGARLQGLRFSRFNKTKPMAALTRESRR